MKDGMRLRDKVALITGAGGPMGSAIARRLAEEGAQLILTDISERRLMSGTEGAGGESTVRVRSDVRIREQAAQVVDAGIARFGRIDILVNVVGGIKDTELKRPFITMTESRFDDTFTLNLKGSFHLVQLIAPCMMERAYGKIVNIGSISMSGEAGQADYGAAKAAVMSMTRSLAMELAPHINVNCISPATIRTSVLDRTPPEERRYYMEKTLLKRFGEARDIANAVLFLASDEAAYITGENLCVSGGVAVAL
jgi:NAD(P)-dependent dehydrogenase (short-subunit alcohol dehydrogenase family)